jgi:1-deoxy-D-xylulose-5-phosphate synthase
VKKLNLEELEILASDVREALFNRLSKIGGHFGPNFGMVEATIALHYVFSSPVDKIVFDVSHQSYTHKILTGRKNGYINDEDFILDSGYTNPDESIHDFFNIGHTSTSISLASGLVKARDLKGNKENIICVIGDGSLSGGEALEGLDFVGGEISSNMIIIVNDNEMSIAENHGGLYKSLKDLRLSNGSSTNNIFKAFGLDYIYVEEGNDIKSLIEVFKKVKDINHPIVLHIHTLKGKGYEPAVNNKEGWHWTSPFNIETGERVSDEKESYISIARDYYLKKAREDKDFFVICPAVPGAVGFGPDYRKQMGKQFVDVGICEEHALSMASGGAKGGSKPCLVSSASFLQRTYDQMSQCVCINSSPVTVVSYNYSMNSLRDVTHLGIFGLSTFNDIPNLVILAPTSKEEVETMLDWSIEQTTHPVLILLPSGEVRHSEPLVNYDEINTYQMTRKGEKIALIALGDFYSKGEELVDALIKEGYNPTLINPRFASGIDKKMLDELTKTHQLIITLEDGVKDNGFGEKIASYLGPKDIKVINYGLEKKFIDRYNPQELLESLEMTTPQIIKKIKEIL